MIIPYNNNILVELQDSRKSVLTPDSRGGTTRKQGLCVAVSFKIQDRSLVDHPLKDKVVYFDEFEDTTNYTVDGKKYALIEIDRIRGYEE